MSWEKRNDGRYVVRWRDSDGRSRSKTVFRQRDAIALDADMKRKRSMGELIAHERGDIELRDFYALWWERHALINLSERTRTIYARLWRCHIAKPLGVRKLRAIRAEQIQTLIAKLSKDLSPASVVRVVSILQNVLQRAVEWEYIATNPAARVRKPRQQHRRGRTITMAKLNDLCAELDYRSEMFVRVLAHTGMRPGELRALQWGDLQAGALVVERAASADQIGPTKTRRRRRVDLRPEARKALLEWYMFCGQPPAEDLVFPGKGGKLWSDNAYSQWTVRKFGTAAARSGIKGLQPYDLRHTFVSMLIAEGASWPWIAAQAGHSMRTMLDTYAHLIDDKSVSSECDANPSIIEMLRSDGRS